LAFAPKTCHAILPIRLTADHTKELHTRKIPLEYVRDLSEKSESNGEPIITMAIQVDMVQQTLIGCPVLAFVYRNVAVCLCLDSENIAPILKHHTCFYDIVETIWQFNFLAITVRRVDLSHQAIHIQYSHMAAPVQTVMNITTGL